MAATVTWCKELAMPESVLAVEATSQRRVREWEVCLSAADATGPDIALTGTGIPAIGAAYGSTILTVQTLSARLKERTNRKVYIVTAEYGYKATTGGSVNTVAPWDRGISYSYDSIEYSYDLMKDFDPNGAKAVLNSADDLYAGPIKARRINRVITASLAEKVSVFNYASQVVFIDSVNSGSYTINGETFAAQTLLCRAVKANQQTWIDSAGVSTDYYDIVYVFEASSDPNGFKLVLLNQGMRYKDGSEHKPILKNNKQIPRPDLLDAAGAVLAVGGTPTYKTFYPHRVVNWGTSPFV